MANKRFIDFPIATTVGDNDIILIWQSGANKQTTKATILSGVPDSLNDLTDVTISGLTNGQILRYDSVSGQWENTDQGNLDLNDLNDVTIVSPTNGQVLVYNSSTGKWENSSGGYVPYVGAVTTVNLGAQTIQAGSFVKQSGTASQFLKADGSVDSTAYGTGSVTSVGLTMPSAFNVANSPITTAGTLAVTGAGTVAQYIRGDGSLADFPESSGGGSSVSYYLNGSVAQGTIGGIAYKELSKVPILGAGTDFTINADGYIASFITDAGDPNLLEIPGGNWNFETYFSASSGGGSPTFYVELYKVNAGGTATLIASSSTSPELIAFGTNLTPYFSSLAVPTTTLALTDRLAVRYYVTHSGRTITLHTENNHLCQIITTFTTGLTALNGLTAQVQNFAVGTTGTDFNIASAVATHTFNLPTASATNRGALSSADWALFTQAYNDKINSAAVTGTTTKTLTLTQQDGGTITASWSDLNTDAVLSVFGRTGNVIAVSGDYTTAQVTESGNLYYTEARVNANTNVAANTAARHNAVTLGTANGLSLSTQVLSLGLASAGVTGALSGSDWSTFNSKQNALTNPVTGTGTTNYLPKFYGLTLIGNSNLINDSSGNLGLGVTPSSWTLFSGVLELNGGPSIGGFANTTYFMQNVVFNSGFKYKSTDAAGRYELGQEHKWFSAPSGTAGNAITFTQPMTLTSGGNLILTTGTVSDNGARLQVSGGNLTVTVADTPQVLLTHSNTSRTFLMAVDGGNAFFRANSSNNILFQVNGGDTALTLASNRVATFDTTSAISAIFNSTNASGGYLAFRRSGTNIGYLGNSAQLGIGVNNALELRADNNLYLTTTSGTLAMLSNGNVGIGTPSPGALLHLVQNTSNLNLYLQNTNGSGKTWALNSDLNGRFNIHDTAANRLTISTEGNVLIGLAGNNGGILRAKDLTNRYIIAFEKWNSTLTLGGFFQNSGSSGEMILVDTNGSQNVLISSSGNSYWNAPSARFSIGTTVNTTDLFRVNGSTYTNTIMTWNPENDNRSGIAWRLGAASIGAITPNRRLRVNVGGVEYYIGAVEV